MRPEALALDTLAVHAGRDDLAALGVHAPPLDLSTTYPFTDLAEAVASLDALTTGAPDAATPVYSRLLSPTVARFERGLAVLEGAEGAVAFASGMAALTAVVLATRTNQKNHVVGVRPLYGTTDKLLSGGLLGVDVTWTDADGIAEAVRPDTCLVVVETPVNPTLELVDLEDAVRQAGSVPVLVDSTFATPVLQRPLDHGAALVFHSATKFIGGHSDVLAGVVAGAEAWMRRLREVRVFTGGVLHPLAGYLLHRGLPTLPLRVERMQATATALATGLAAHPGVARVYYPGLPGGDPRALIGRQMAGPGPMLSFEVGGGFAVADRLMRALRIITPAVSLGSTDTLIQHPAGLTQRVVQRGDGDTKSGPSAVSEGLLRLAVGLEAAADLLADLTQALDAAA
ncbi:MAG TPA: PLP-dependent transferase [Rhodothermales bacterium]|nr:PLP-dependent transferase [Rhodothermales bacterium]